MELQDRQLSVLRNMNNSNIIRCARWGKGRMLAFEIAAQEKKRYILKWIKNAIKKSHIIYTDEASDINFINKNKSCEK